MIKLKLGTFKNISPDICCPTELYFINYNSIHIPCPGGFFGLEAIILEILS